MKLNINDEQGIELLHFIFERELKPPFSKGDKDIYDRDTYHNRDGEKIGMLDSYMNFYVHFIIYENIEHKVCQVFELSYDTWDWWYAIRPHLKSWLESNLNVKLNKVDL